MLRLEDLVKGMQVVGIDPAGRGEDAVTVPYKSS